MVESVNSTNGVSTHYGWFVLLTFSLCSIGNAMAWLTFAPVPSESAQYFDVTINQIDLFSIIFMIVGIPVGILAIYLVDKIGLKTSIRISTAFNLVGTVVRLATLFFGGYDPETSNWNPAPAWCYPVAIAATAVISVRLEYCPTHQFDLFKIIFTSKQTSSA